MPHYHNLKHYVKSKEWKDMLLDLIFIRGMICEKCLNPIKEIGHVRMLHVSFERVYHEEPEDLILVCESCKAKEINRRNQEYQKQNVQEKFKKFAEKYNNRLG